MWAEDGIHKVKMINEESLVVIIRFFSPGLFEAKFRICHSKRRSPDHRGPVAPLKVGRCIESAQLLERGSAHPPAGAAATWLCEMKRRCNRLLVRLRWALAAFSLQGQS